MGKACLATVSRRTAFTALLLCAGLAAARVAVADTTGTILGTVRDPQGAAIAGATVTARQAATNLTRSVESDEAGNYRIPSLPIGEYVVTAEASGFGVAAVVTLVLAAAAVEVGVALAANQYAR